MSKQALFCSILVFLLKTLILQQMLREVIGGNGEKRQKEAVAVIEREQIIVQQTGRNLSD